MELYETIPDHLKNVAKITISGEYAWKADEAIELLMHLKNHQERSYYVSRGDVMEECMGRLEYTTYDYWAFPSEQRSLQQLVPQCHASIDYAIDYIRSYCNRFGDNYYYIMVIINILH